MDGAGDEASGHAERDARSRSWSRRPVLLGDGGHGLNDRSVEGTELSLVENNRVRLHHRVGHGLAEVVLRDLGVVQVRAVDKCWQMLTTSTDASGAYLRLLSANATSIVVCTGSPQSGDERPMAESSRERRPAGGAQQQVGDRYVQGVGRVPRQCGSTGLDAAAPCRWHFLGSTSPWAVRRGALCEAAAGVDRTEGLTVGLGADSHLSTEVWS